MSKFENCVKRKEAGYAPMELECMECLKELSCPVYQEYRRAKMNNTTNSREEIQ